VTHAGTELRFLGWDLLRLVMVFCTSVFHVYESLVFQDQVPAVFDGTLYGFLILLARFGSFTGFSLVGLCFYLLGRSVGDSSKLRLVLLKIMIGLIVLALAAGELEWDVFHLFAVALIVISGAGFKLGYRICLAMGLACILAAPAMAHDLRPDCTSWPLFPWLLWPVGFFWIGRAFRGPLQTTSRVGPLLLAGFAVVCGTWVAVLNPVYYWVPLGPSFSCAVFSQPLLAFWGPQLGLLGLAVLGTHHRVVRVLQGWWWVRVVSHSAWNRRFFVSYCLQFLILAISARLIEQATPAKVLAVWILVVSLPDIISFFSKSIRPSNSAKSLG
jgi:hypothetical protein